MAAPSERVREIAEELGQLFELTTGNARIEVYLENGSYAAVHAGKRWTKTLLRELDHRVESHS